MAKQPNEADQVEENAVTVNPEPIEAQEPQGGPDDGFTPEERAQYEAMRADDTVPREGEPEPAEQKEPDPAEPEIKEPAEKDSAVEDDDDDGEPEAKAPEGEDKKPRRVRFTKYEREVGERDKRIKELEQKDRERIAESARLEERIAIINDALTPKPQQKQQQDDDPRPDPEQDIFAFSQWQERQLKRLSETVNELRGGFEQQHQQTQVERTYAQDAQRFSNQNPDFADAYQYLLNSRQVQLAEIYFGKDLTEQGVQLTPQEWQRVKQGIETEERGLVEAALENRVSPAERLYRLARSLGYRKADAQQRPQPTNGAAKLQAEAKPAPAKPTVSDEIRRVKEGADASLSLSNGGSAPALTITPEKLARMSQDEFNDLMDRLPETQQRALMGA